MSEIQGLDQLIEELEYLAENAGSIASAAVCAAGGQLANAIRSQAPAEMRDYIGFRQIPSQGTKIRAVVGFGYGPRSEPRHRSTPPTAQQSERLRRIVQTGVSSTISPARAAMVAAGAMRLDAILE